MKDIEQIEDLLKRLRKEKNWSYAEVLINIKDRKIEEKDIRKWELGLKYPDLDMIYKLSELYKIPSDEFIRAKNNSYENGMNSINMRIVKWISYFLNVSIKVAIVITILLYIAAFIGSLMFFISIASKVKH